MDGYSIKLILIQIAVVIVIILFIGAWLANRKRINSKATQDNIDVNIKDDSFWEKRFNGLKADYEDRELYHQQRYDSLKNEYESRIQYLRTMVEESRQDYLGIKNTLTEMQRNNMEITAKLQAANLLITEYEDKCKTLEIKIQTIENQINQ